MVLAIDWTVSSEIIEGWRTPNWYGLLFVSGLIIGYFVIKKIFSKENIPNESLDKLVLYTVLATVIGARLGHVFFYEWSYYKDHLGEIIMVWKGGLASHGAALAILISLYLYSKLVVKKPLLWILDRMAAPIAIGATFIRLGNLMNHEIVGHVTTVPWGFKFLHYDCGYPYQCDWSMIPVRHPSQLYEAILYLIIFGVLLFLFWKRNLWQKPGFIFGAFLILVFTARFFIEFTKEGQTARDFELVLNTGQLLSIPFVLAGCIILIRSLVAKNKS